MTAVYPAVVSVGYLKEIHRYDDFVVVCHIPELSEADLPTLSLKRKWILEM